MSPIIGAAEIASLRAVTAGAVTTEATVLRKSSVPDGSGGQTDSYAAVGTYPCSLSRFPIRPREVEGSQTIRATSLWQFTFDRDVVIRQTDRLVCAGRTFEVAGQGVGSTDLVQVVLTEEIV